MNTLLIPEDTRRRLGRYREDLVSSRVQAGGHLMRVLQARPAALEREADLLAALLDTKQPQIFAESAVVGDGTDWNRIELGLLGDLSVAVPVTVYDDGTHVSPSVHEVPFRATLLFTPGALLRHGRGGCPADWEEVVDAAGKLEAKAYAALYERRLLPVFRFISESAEREGRAALVTLPGLGCGQFAGLFKGTLGALLERALVEFVEKHGQALPGIRVIVFDPYNECANAGHEIGGISLRVRPWLQGNRHRSQLARPAVHGDAGEDFSECALFSVVAWDHVSWPGNDFYGGSRCTDDGVKAAATDAMRALTGVEGGYQTAAHAYLPPLPYRTWAQVVERHDLRLSERLSGWRMRE